MGLTDFEKESLNSLSKIIDYPIDIRKVEFYAWKRILGTRDVDFFHSIAQSLGQQSLADHGNFSFVWGIPDTIGRYWYVTLLDNKNDFIKKYGMDYNVIKF